MSEAKIAKSLNLLTLFMKMLGFSGPKGSNMRPKWYQNGPREGKEAEKKRKDSREAQKCSRERLGSALGRHPRISGIPWGRSVDIATWLSAPSRPCVSEGLGPKSKEKCCKVARFRDVAISLAFASQ